MSVPNKMRKFFKCILKQRFVEMVNARGIDSPRSHGTSTPDSKNRHALSRLVRHFSDRAHFVSAFLVIKNRTKSRKGFGKIAETVISLAKVKHIKVGELSVCIFAIFNLFKTKFSNKIAQSARNIFIE